MVSWLSTRKFLPRNAVDSQRGLGHAFATMFGDIRNTHGEKLDYTFHPGKASTRNLVVLGHGVTGNKDRPFVIALAESLAAAGIPALRFSFSGNGASEGRFTESNISKEV